MGDTAAAWNKANLNFYGRISYWYKGTGANPNQVGQKPILISIIKQNIKIVNPCVYRRLLHHLIDQAALFVLWLLVFTFRIFSWVAIASLKPFPDFVSTSDPNRHSITMARGNLSRNNSASTAGSSNHSRRSKHSGERLPPPILVYHESARSIVFRDHLRRAASRSSSNLSDKERMEKQHKQLEDQQLASPSEGGNQAGGEDQVVRKAEHKRQTSYTDNPQHDPFIDVSSELTHKLGLDKNETVVPSQAGIEATEIGGFTPKIVPLSPLELGPDDSFELLLQQSPIGPDNIDQELPSDWSPSEREVVQMLRAQKACVKTIRNPDWTSFLKRFEAPNAPAGRWSTHHADSGPQGSDFPFNSFVTSTSLLPPGGKKMRCFGSLSQFTVGCCFALPSAYGDYGSEDDACAETKTWSWPAGYSAKTEFNIDGRGNLINGRQEALTPLSVLREYNNEYVYKDEYTVAGRKVSGLSQIPYNEIFLRVGGRGRIISGRDAESGKECDDAKGTGRSFDRGVGLPVALFVRSASFGNLIALLRAKSRLVHVLGEDHFAHLPLLVICPEDGTRVLTAELQVDLWKVASSSLNPFQNPAIAHRTTIDKNDEPAFQQKVDELLDLDESIQEKLTSEELAHMAGGFGATDETVADILKKAMMHDLQANRVRRDGSEESHELQTFVNEGLAFAVRSGDYLTARQLLMLYTVVAAKGEELNEADDDSLSEYSISEFKRNGGSLRGSERSQDDRHRASLGKDAEKLVEDLELLKMKDKPALAKENESRNLIPLPPPPPPLDTDRLRGATNSDGLLAVLGAAQILKAMQDGSAKKRSVEVVDAVDEWCKAGEQSMTFRISSW